MLKYGCNVVIEVCVTNVEKYEVTLSSYRTMAHVHSRISVHQTSSALFRHTGGASVGRATRTSLRTNLRGSTPAKGTNESHYAFRGNFVHLVAPIHLRKTLPLHTISQTLREVDAKGMCECGEDLSYPDLVRPLMILDFQSECDAHRFGEQERTNMEPTSDPPSSRSTMTWRDSKIARGTSGAMAENPGEEKKLRHERRR